MATAIKTVRTSNGLERTVERRDGMNMISKLRQEIRAHGSTEIDAAEFDQLQAEWIRRVGAEEEIERWRKDAERYRWLRDSHDSGSMIRMLYEDGEATPGACDEAIDGAMRSNAVSEPTERR